MKLASTVGIVSACDFLGAARASSYRRRPGLGPASRTVRPPPDRALRPDERAHVPDARTGLRIAGVVISSFTRPSRSPSCWPGRPIKSASELEHHHTPRAR